MRLLAGALILALPALAAAQPSPTSRAARGKDKFEFSVRLQGARADEALRIPHAGDAEYVGDATAALRYRRGWKRSSFSLGAQAGAERYSRRSELGRLDYAGEGALDVGLSRRTTLALGQTYVSAYTRDIAALADSGLVLPLVVANRAESTGRLERLGSHWQSTFEVRYRRVDFPSGDLASGSEVMVNPSLWRRLGRSHAVGVGYLFERGWARAFSGDVHGGIMGVSRRAAKGLGYRLEAGGAYSQRSRKSMAIGAAELSLTRRKDRVSARYERGIQEAFGLSRQVLTDLFSLSVSRRIARPLSLGASGTFGINTDPADRTFRYRSDTYTGALQWAVTKDLSAGAGWSYWRSTFAKDVVTPSSRGWVSLGYRLGW
jgi:hypothetical protein